MIRIRHSAEPVLSRKGRLIAGAPPQAEIASGRRIYRDALVANILGYRPLMLDLIAPDVPAPVPVLIHIYGGGWASGSHKRDPFHPDITRWIDAGIAVANIQHRHSLEAKAPAQLHDVKAAVRYLRHYAGDLDVDPDRFAAYGHSSGGVLASLLAVTGQAPATEGKIGITGPDSAVQAAVGRCSFADFTTMPTQAAPGSAWAGTAANPHTWLFGAPTDQVPELAAAMSPITYVSASSAPLLLIAGADDDGMPLEQTERLATAYEQAGATAERIVVPAEGHIFTAEANAHYADISLGFIQKHLAS